MTELHFKCRHNSGLSIGWLLSGSTKIFQNNPFWINNNCCWNVCSIQADVSTLESTVSIYNLPAEVQFHTLKKQPQPNRLSWINASVINYDPFLEGNLINISQSSFQHWNSEPIQKNYKETTESLRNAALPEQSSKLNTANKQSILQLTTAFDFPYISTWHMRRREYFQVRAIRIFELITSSFEVRKVEWRRMKGNASVFTSYWCCCSFFYKSKRCQYYCKLFMVEEKYTRFNFCSLSQAHFYIFSSYIILYVREQWKAPEQCQQVSDVLPCFISATAAPSLRVFKSSCFVYIVQI